MGEKKRMSSQMAKGYSPSAVEKSWVWCLLFIITLINFTSIFSIMYMLSDLGGMNGGRKRGSLWQMLTAPNLHLSLWVSHLLHQTCSWVCIDLVAKKKKLVFTYMTGFAASQCDWCPSYWTCSYCCYWGNILTYIPEIVLFIGGFLSLF